MPQAARRQPAAPVIQEASLPAPMGGLNASSSAAAMPGSDCIRLWNLIPSEHGLRIRLGEREWCTGLTGFADNQVRSVIGYTGSNSDGSTNRVFATTTTGIWDVTDSRQAWAASTAYVIGDFVINDGNLYICDTDGTSDSSGGPTGSGSNIADGTTQWDFVETARKLTFGTQTGRAGYGIHHGFVTPGGHFLVYCDEVNGLHLYTESTDTWAAIAAGTTQAWAANTLYLVGDRVINGGNEYLCDTEGTSAGSGGPSGTGTNITDGTTQWDYVGAADTDAIGPSLADQHLSLDADPANFVFAGVFKRRLWFAEKDTARAWYLDADAIYGTATSFNLATQFRSGGHLVGLWNWTYDGGAGMDDSLVAISSGGDVAIYQGTDPSSASTFSIRGVWSIGATPKGKRIATAAGGDILLLSRSGCIPLSALVVSGGADKGQYATAKIGPLFNSLMLSRADMDGWGVYLHPEESALVITVPVVDGSPTEQLVMSLSTKGWARFRGLSIFSADAHGGKLYFGTDEGAVHINDGYLDGRTLADPDSYSEIEASIITAFSNLGSARKKQFRMVRPTFLADGATPAFKVAARYKYDFTEAGTPDAVVSSGSVWDSGTWDSSTWGGEYSATQQVRGVSGMGVEAAIACSIKSSVRTVLVGFDVFYVTGGLL